MIEPESEAKWMGGCSILHVNNTTKSYPYTTYTIQSPYGCLAENESEECSKLHKMLQSHYGSETVSFHCKCTVVHTSHIQKEKI